MCSISGSSRSRPQAEHAGSDYRQHSASAIANSIDRLRCTQGLSHQQLQNTGYSPRRCRILLLCTEYVLLAVSGPNPHSMHPDFRNEARPIASSFRARGELGIWKAGRAALERLEGPVPPWKGAACPSIGAAVRHPTNPEPCLILAGTSQFPHHTFRGADMPGAFQCSWPASATLQGSSGNKSPSLLPSSWEEAHTAGSQHSYLLLLLSLSFFFLSVLFSVFPFLFSVPPCVRERTCHKWNVIDEQAGRLGKQAVEIGERNR